MEITSRAMRDALSSFATGVTIVTTSESDNAGGQSPVGMTASSFNSVSMEPPLVLWSVTKAALSAPVFRDATHFSIHILASNQVWLSNQFAQRGTEKFAEVDYSVDGRGVPVLSGVACRFDCTQWNVYEGGDHWIIVGEVTHLERAKTESLVFSGGSYATANPIRAPKKVSADANIEQSPIDDMLIYNLARAHRELSVQFHEGVRDCGLSVPEWRVLASLHGPATRDLDDLAARTFIDPHALVDMLVVMEQEDLCKLSAKPRVDDKALRISGTQAGHARVEHLFALGRQQEDVALKNINAEDVHSEHVNPKSLKSGMSAEHGSGHAHPSEQDLATLIKLLQRVINNTSRNS